MKHDAYLKRMLNGPLLHGELNTDTVLMKWRTEGGTSGNANRESSQEGVTHEEHSETLDPPPLVHHVTIAKQGYERHTEVRHGDVILDFLTMPNFTGRLDPQFIIAGIVYVPKDPGQKLTEGWDVRTGGRPVVKSILLRPQG